MLRNTGIENTKIQRGNVLNFCSETSDTTSVMAHFTSCCKQVAKFYTETWKTPPPPPLKHRHKLCPTWGAGSSLSHFKPTLTGQIRHRAGPAAPVPFQRLQQVKQRNTTLFFFWIYRSQPCVSFEAISVLLSLVWRSVFFFFFLNGAIKGSMSTFKVSKHHMTISYLSGICIGEGISY